MTAARRYTLRLTPSAEGVSARLERAGPANILAVGKGRVVAAAPALASLLFPICPHAHAAAALRAVEQAAGIMLPAGQIAARELLVLSEGIAGCVWRMALNWPSLSGREKAPALVKQARMAAAGLPAALFAGPWQGLGGAPLSIQPGMIAEALAQLEACLVQLDATVPQRSPVAAFPALGDDIQRTDADPDHDIKEETPRTLYGDGADHFQAQRQHGWALLALAKKAAASLSEDGPLGDVGSVSGTGMGVAMTARGRLRHIIHMDEGRMSTWSAAAPTDWNFASAGPLVQAAARLAPGPRLVEQAGDLVAAFDPCAPCQLVTEPAEVLAHA